MNLKEKQNYIVELEWDFFQQVHNEGGRASCQNNPETFYVMRKSQFESWNEPLIDSYLADLQIAKRNGRNLVMEKYAWMMKDTAPLQFENIVSLLPAVSDNALPLIEEILQIQLLWMEEYTGTYPLISAGNRVVRKEQATPGTASFETYLRGELCTYSLNTLKLYLDHIKQLAAEGKNIVLITMQNTVGKYGCQSLEEAEKQASAVDKRNTIS